MFEVIKFPVCVNPTRELLKKVLDSEMIKKRVQIIVERKDVVYKLTSEDIHNF